MRIPRLMPIQLFTLRRPTRLNPPRHWHSLECSCKNFCSFFYLSRCTWHRRSTSSSKGVNLTSKKSDVPNGKVDHPPNCNHNKNKAASKLNLNRTPLRSKIPQAVSTPPVTRPASATTPSSRIGGRPLGANNKTSAIAAAKVVNKTSNNVAIRQHNHYNSSVQSSRMLLAKPTPTISQQRIGCGENKWPASNSTNLLKSVKPGLAQPTAAIQGSKIPRPNSVSSSGGQSKSSPSAVTARLASHATSSSSIAAVHRHLSSPSLLLQANRTTTTTGVKSCIPSHLHKSTSRLHLTHNSKGESSLIRSDLVSAHWKETNSETRKKMVVLFFPFLYYQSFFIKTNQHM